MQGMQSRPAAMHNFQAAHSSHQCSPLQLFPVWEDTMNNLLWCCWHFIALPSLRPKISAMHASGVGCTDAGVASAADSAHHCAAGACTCSVSAGRCSPCHCQVDCSPLSVPQSVSTSGNSVISLWRRSRSHSPISWAAHMWHGALMRQGGEARVAMERAAGHAR